MKKSEENVTAEIERIFIVEMLMLCYRVISFNLIDGETVSFRIRSKILAALLIIFQ